MPRASLTGLAFAHDDFDLPIERILHADCPHYYRGAQPGESEEAFAARLAGNLEQLILREGPDTVAAFFAEPVMGAGGVIVPPATYFDRIQPILKKYEILFVADEVICGFGRTGNMFGAQTFNLQPDIMTLAKALSAGYQPISANLVTNELYDILLAQSDKLGIFGHGYTYSAHPVPAAVALETLKIYEERDIVAQVRRVGPRMLAGIRSYADHPLIGEARGIGLIGAVELVRDKATKQSFDPKAGVAAYLVRRAQHHGAILRNMPGDNVAFCPPLIISEGRNRRDDGLLRQGARRYLGDGEGKGPRVSVDRAPPGRPKARHRSPVGGSAAAGQPQAWRCMSEPIVRFVGIGKTYDGVTRIVDELDLDIERGEFLTLLGPSGSGKTTTLMLLAGFETPTAGEILLEGKPLSRVPPYQRNIGMVFQNYALFPHMTVAENIGFPLSVRGVAAADIAKRVERALDMVQLGGFGATAAGATLRRPAAARRGGPRAGVRAEADPDGRTARARWTSSCASRCSSRSGGCTSGSA